MKTQVAKYESYSQVMDAFIALSRKGFPMNYVALYGKSHLRSINSVERTPLIVCTVLGTLLGIFSGLGVFAVPGFGFAYEGGFVLGLIYGFDVGIVIGLIGTICTIYTLEHDKVLNHFHVRDGQYHLMVKGSEYEIEEAEHILHTEGEHLK